MKELQHAQESHLDKVGQIKKSENWKEASVTFQTSLNKESEKARLKLFDEGKVKKTFKKIAETKWKSERPKSANSLVDVFSSETDLKKSPKSWEFSHLPGLLEKVKLESGEEKKQKEVSENREPCCCCCWREPKPECSSLFDLDSRSSSVCGLNASEEGQNELWARFHYRPRIKCRSNPNFSKTASEKIHHSERELHKIKRSLRLLGFELSDFGISSDWMKNPPKKKPDEKSASFSTKITNRSVSLDSLRAAVKRAWIDDNLGESHRRLLAQAAYEEWYFRKERELWKKRNEDRLMRMKAKENLRDHFEQKKEQSEEEYRKWLHRKRMKRKRNENNMIQNQKNHFNKLMKTKEESEKAFVKWKKSKEEELEKKKKEKQKEEERRLESEKEKNNKKIIAEKAFQQWKTKLKETEILEEKKRQRWKKRQEVEEKKREKGSQISFEMWKAVKDEQIKKKIKQSRQACRITRKERLAQMEERMYEAEQAFEEWLEKVDSRKQKQFSGVSICNKNIPWIPA